ncbi:MAG TPA: FmdB family zinc ribbon protein [Candidatus Acidoferrales bacterium]
MPLYPYKCVKCGNRYDKIENVSAPEKQKCPKCGGRAERQIAAPAIQFKGSGWYVTDYGGKGAAPKSAGEGSGDGAPKTAEKSSESKTDSKSESKSESKPATSDNSNQGAAKRKK